MSETPSTELVPAAEIAQLEAAMADRGRWWGPEGPTLQARYVALKSAELTGEAPPAKEGALSVEKRAIETKMRDHTSEYWRGVRGPDGMTDPERRYREILESPERGFPEAASPMADVPKAEAAVSTDDCRASPDEVRIWAEPEVVEALELHGSDQFETRLRRAQDVIAGVEANIGDRGAQVEFEGAVEALPATVKASILHVIAEAPSPGDTRTWDERANDRFGRIAKSLTGPDLDAFCHFWRTSPEGERNAMLWTLGNS